MSYFYTIEVFPPFIKNFITDLPTDNIFKVSIISDTFDYDLEVDGYIQAIMTEVFDEEIDINLSFNPDFFPASLSLEEESEIEEEEIEDEDFENREISFDGLPVIHYEPDFFDFVMNSYIIYDQTEQDILLRANVVIEPATAECINYETNITVH